MKIWTQEILSIRNLIKVKYKIYKLPSNLSKISCLKKQIKSDQKETLAQPNKQALVDHSKSISVYFWLDYLFCILANIFQKQSFVYQSATQNWWTKTENLTLLIQNKFSDIDMTCFLYTYKIFFMVAWYNRPYQNQISANLSNEKIETQNINYFVKMSMSSPISLSLIHIWRCRRYSLCRSRWSPYH